MPTRTIIAFLMLLPGPALAECGIAMSGGTMTIVVGKKSNNCFRSTEFASTFKSTINEAFEEEDPARSAHRRAFDARNARSAKLWAIAERQHQVTGRRYFGQRQ